MRQTYLVLNRFISLGDLFLLALLILLQVLDDDVQLALLGVERIDVFLVVGDLLLQTRELLAHDARLTAQLLVGLLLVAKFALVLVLDVEDLAVSVFLDLLLGLFVLAILLARLVVSLLNNDLK